MVGVGESSAVGVEIGGVMQRPIGEASRAASHRPTVRAGDRVVAAPWGFAALAAGWSGLVVVLAAADAFEDPASSGALLTAAVLQTVALLAIAVGCRIVHVAAGSPTRHVFCSRGAFWTGVPLVLGGAAIGASLVRRAPLDRLAAHGEVTAYTIADLGLLGASLICLGGGIIDLIASWDARRDERSWGRLHRRS